ncbi:MAG: zinc ribbon domain-containing protein [Haloarculaceae archaeon]
MSDSPEEPPPPEQLSDELVEKLDGLGRSELEAVRSYVTERIDTFPSSIAAEIEADRDGEILGVEDHGAYALVREHPPDPDGPGVDTDRVSIYHVRREQQMDGSESLHWTYVGDMRAAKHTQCGSCGGTVHEDASVCPHCSEEIDHPEEGN